jgi:hypothetical protein
MPFGSKCSQPIDPVQQMETIEHLQPPMVYDEEDIVGANMANPNQ